MREQAESAEAALGNREETLLGHLSYKKMLMQGIKTRKYQNCFSQAEKITCNHQNH